MILCSPMISRTTLTCGSVPENVEDKSAPPPSARWRSGIEPLAPAEWGTHSGVGSGDKMGRTVAGGVVTVGDGVGGEGRLDPLEDEDGEVVHARGVGRGRAPALEGPVGRHRGGPTGFVVFEGDDPDEDSMGTPPPLPNVWHREGGVRRRPRRDDPPRAEAPIPSIGSNGGACQYVTNMCREPSLLAR